MSLQCRPVKSPRRHDLVFVTRDGWRAMLANRRELAADPLIAQWVENGWPLIGRRAMPDDGDGVPLGLPMPPFAGKRRLSFVMPPETIAAVVPPLSLQAVMRDAPEPWQPTLDALCELGAEHWVDVRVCGGLACQALTSLSYLTESSDLDVLIYVHRGIDIRALTAGIAGIEYGAPMRVDGELIREDGAAVSWREIHDGAEEVLVKTVASVALVGSQSFVSGGPPS